MPQFRYQATTGDSEPQSGCIAAESLSAAISALQSQGLTVLSIRKEETAEAEEGAEEAAAAGSLGEGSPSAAESAPRQDAVGSPEVRARAASAPGGWPPAGSDDDRTIRAHLANIVAQRDTLPPALLAIADEMPPGLTRRQMRQLAGQIDQGTTVDALRESYGLVGWLLPMLAGGIGTASARRALHELMAEAARIGQFEKQRRVAWIYPLLILAVAMAVLVFLSLVVIPVFREMFEDFDLELPALTVMVLAIAKLIRFHAAALVGTIAALAAVFYLLFRMVTTWSVTEGLVGYLTAGSTRQVAAAASFTRTLAGLVDAGLSPPGALRLAGNQCGRNSLRRAADSLADHLEQSLPDWRRTPAARRLPATLVHALGLLSVTGQSGSRPANVRLLHQLAEMYAERVRNRSNWTSGMFAPLSILVVGFVVLIVVLALFLPLVMLVSGLT